MSWFHTSERELAAAIGRLAYCNPFLPERIELERRVLGAAFDERGAHWNVRPDWSQDPPNVTQITAVSEELAARVRDRVKAGEPPSDGDRRLYEEMVLCVFYHRHRGSIHTAAEALADRESPVGQAPIEELWDAFLACVDHYRLQHACDVAKRELPHLFACLLQICRAFHNIFQWIFGLSGPAMRLRAQVWQSIFTHDIGRYRRVLHDRMSDFTTLVTGPSGTGKELVARAIGQSHYVPFDAKRCAFVDLEGETFFALNLSALSETLIESELFGHKRGAFTGALTDSKGRLELCPKHGAVFLDELGDVSPAIQVKLLRMLENRSFNRVGESVERRFHGKIIAATNRDLATRMQEGAFRTDLYYRLCSDTITTPSLRERLLDDPGERRHLIDYLAARVVGEESESVAVEVEAWIDEHLGEDYAWPGNIRELDQCVRNVLIRRSYVPALRDGVSVRRSDDAFDELAQKMRSGRASAEDVLRRYCSLVYRQTGSYEKAARLLQIDRRTVRAKAALDE